MPSYSKVSAGNEDERKVTSNRNRGCLEDCGCNKDRPNRCGCKSLKGCSAACACGGDCALGLREEQEKAEEVDFDTAVRLHDGEDVPTEITEVVTSEQYGAQVMKLGNRCKTLLMSKTAPTIP